MGWIYNATNKLNGKGYIGQTIRPIQERLKEHRDSKKYRGIAGAIKKYGWENFHIDCYECPDYELNKHERWMVNLMGTLSPGGYNLREGGGNRGKASEETKQKQREAHLGENNSMHGKKHTDETKQKQREVHLGKNNHMYGKTGEKHHNSKRVYQYDLDGIFINSFGTVKEAGQYLNKAATNISACARGAKRYKTAYKFKWSYELNIFL